MVDDFLWQLPYSRVLHSVSYNRWLRTLRINPSFGFLPLSASPFPLSGRQGIVGFGISNRALSFEWSEGDRGAGQLQQ